MCEVAYQLLYPYETTLPFARNGDVNVGNRPRNELSAELQKQFDASTVELTSGGHTLARPLSKLGGIFNADHMTEPLATYPLWQRLIPLSIVFIQPRVDALVVDMSGVQMAAVAADIAKELSYEPIDASMAIKDGELVVVAAKKGASVTAKDVRDALAQTSYNAGRTRIIVDSKPIIPKRTDGDIAAVKVQAEGALARTITLKVGDRGDFSPDTATRAKWISISMDGEAPKLTANTELIREYVDAVNEKVSVPAGVSVVSYVDNIEQGRTQGESGDALDVDKAVDQLSRSLLDNGEPAIVTGQLVSVEPTVKYDRSYTNTQQGLQAYVAYATSTQNVRIVVQQLDGAGWSASGRAGESIPSASTYKLYVMLRVFDDINNGKLTWDAPMLDTNVGGCFERTIVPSTNPCAEEFIRQYGRDQLNDYVHARGFSSGTGFTFTDATHTTAGDLAQYLIGLNNGTLVSGSNRDMLLEKMGRQLYRTGIPSGTKGWTQDKVGFLWDYIHDAAIVHHPKGTYVLVVMTKGYSYSYIANVTRQIESIMYP